MTEPGPTPRRGRLVLVTGADPPGVARLALAVGELLESAVVVDGQILDAMVLGKSPVSGADLVRRQLMRWSAGLALAETYLIEGHDVVVADRVEGDRLEDYLDLAAPEPVHLVVMRAGIDPSTPGWGLWVTTAPEPGDADILAGTAAEVVERLGESLVETTAT